MTKDINMEIPKITHDVEETHEHAIDPYKVFAIEVDEWGVAVLDEGMIPIGVEYHPVSQKLCVMALQDYVSWANLHKNEFEKESTQREKLDRSLFIMRAVPEESELEQFESEKSEPEESEPEESESEKPKSTKDGS